MRTFPETNVSEHVIHLTLDQYNWIKEISEKIGECRIKLKMGEVEFGSPDLVGMRMDAIAVLNQEASSKWWPCEPK